MQKFSGMFSYFLNGGQRLVVTPCPKFPHLHYSLMYALWSLLSPSQIVTLVEYLYIYTLHVCIYNSINQMTFLGKEELLGFEDSDGEL